MAAVKGVSQVWGADRKQRKPQLRERDKFGRDSERRPPPHTLPSEKSFGASVTSLNTSSTGIAAVY